MGRTAVRRHGRWIRVAMIATLISGSLAIAPGARASVTANTTQIFIPATGSEGRATPYPSTIAVTGHSGPVTDVNVSFVGVTHAYPSDLDTLLVGPGGQKVIVMADTGGNTPISGLDFTFDDAATASLPVSMPITAGGTYKPTNGTTFNGTGPAPSGPYATTLASFDGGNANGTWSLFVFDDFSTNGGGSFAGGWSLDITTLTIASFDPPSSSVADEITLKGTGFTGATGVAFGAIVATTFTVDSDTQITATVPPGAVTGRIKVTVPAGQATSDTDFVVRHDRSVSFSLNGAKGAGAIDVADGFVACGNNVSVRVQHRVKKKKWRTVAGDLTDATGAYRVVGLKARGRYRAVAKLVTLGTGDVCAKAISPVVKK